MSKTPSRIGVLDSGLGALSVVNECVKYHFAEEIIVYSDSKRAPWGFRTEEELWHLVTAGVDFLLDQGVEMLILGCNTTDALFKEALIKKYQVPIMGLIQPCIESIMKCFGIRRVVLFATTQTVKSKAYFRSIEEINANIDLIDYPVGELVSFIENGILEKATKIFEDMAKVVKVQQADAYILGCTHFPIALPYLSALIPVQPIDPAVGVLEKILIEGFELNAKEPVIHAYCSADSAKYQALANLYYPTLNLKVFHVDPLEKVSTLSL